MSYRYDRNKKNKPFVYIVGTILLALLLFSPLYNILFSSLQKIVIASWEEKNDINTKTNNFLQSFAAKQSIIEKNNQLQQEIKRLEIDNIRTRYLANQLEIISGYKDQNIIPANILDYGSLASYDHIIINQGLDDGINIGDIVIVSDSVHIGFIVDAYSRSARVMLYSDVGQSINGILYPHNEVLVAKGNGSGNFIIESPREINVEIGDIFYSLNQPNNIIAVVEHIDFDPRDPFKQVYLRYPVNIKQHQIVGIKKTLAPLE